MASAGHLHIDIAAQAGREVALPAGERPATPVGPACFSAPNTAGRCATALSVRLETQHAEALAELLPLLLCGEESAALAFGSYAGSAALHAMARDELGRIQSDEESHAEWLQRLRLGLPAPRPDARLSRQIRRFYISVREPELGPHLARIAALDSAACLLFGALRRRRGPLDADIALSSLFAHIHRDEVRHVTVARRYARLLSASALYLHGIAVDTRQRLTQLLALRADALEALGICPNLTVRRLLAVPRNLFA